jgi:hypothetical protein
MMTIEETLYSGWCASRTSEDREAWFETLHEELTGWGVRHGVRQHTLVAQIRGSDPERNALLGWK